MDISEKKQQAMLIALENAIDLFTGKIRITNFPENSKIISTGFDYACQSYWIVLEHESFSPIHPGCHRPFFTAEYEIVNTNPESSIKTEGATNEH